MAKKKTSKKVVSKKAATKKKSSVKKKVTKKASATSTAAKKRVSKKATKKVVKKSPPKAAAPSKKTGGRMTGSASTKRTTKKSRKKPAASTAKPGSTSASKAASKSASTKRKSDAGGTPSAETKQNAPKQKAATDAPSETPGTTQPDTPAQSPGKPGADAAGDDAKKSGKGITVVQKQPRKTKPKPVFKMPVTEPLLKPGTKWKPLIPSGPAAPKKADEDIAGEPQKSKKLGKRELDKYRKILLEKRAELIGDISNMEEGALRTNSGALSSLPQHMAEQGSDNYDQSISLDLAAVDRTLLREIDDALDRIEKGTYGLCELTGVRIDPDRLAELPWAKYTIEAARKLERNPPRTRE